MGSSLKSFDLVFRFRASKHRPFKRIGCGRAAAFVLNHQFSSNLDTEEKIEGIQEKIKNLGDEEYINQIIDLEKVKKDFLIKNQVSDVFLSSSGAIYKDDNLYALHKKKQEEFYIKFSKQQNFSLFIGRIFASIGPYYNKEEHYAFSSFMNSALNGETIYIKSPNNIERSYVFLPHLIEFVLDSILQTNKKRTQIFDAVQINYEIRELAKIVAETYNVKIQDNSQFNKNLNNKITLSIIV